MNQENARRVERRMDGSATGTVATTSLVQSSDKPSANIQSAPYFIVEMHRPLYPNLYGRPVSRARRAKLSSDWIHHQYTDNSPCQCNSEAPPRE
ncbi:unnamed protein product [Peniophora sp. CBMAI 1063]|nr:unnamed protein product [Peniophora sp. CBMAI 1063]